MEKEKGLVQKIKEAILVGVGTVAIAGYMLYSVGKLREEQGEPVRRYYEQLSPAEMAEIEEERQWLMIEQMSDDPEYWKAREQEKQDEAKYKADLMKELSRYLPIKIK